MKAVIACSEPLLAEKLESGIRDAGVECPQSHHLSVETIHAAIAGLGGNSGNLVVFFVAPQFAPADFTLLKQLCADNAPNVKVIAVGQAHSPSVVLEAIHSGAVDFLDIKADFGRELRELVRRLIAADGEHRVEGKLFTVVGACGGSGSSTLAINLAATLAKRQGSCGLLDLHLRGGDLATLLKLKPRHTLLSLAGKSQFDRTMFDQALVEHECGIRLLASPEPFSNYRQISPQLIQQAVQFARASFPSVVVELEDMEHAEQARTLAASDRIIIPLRLDFAALCRTKCCIDHLLRASVAKDRITLVACRDGQANELPATRFAETLGLPVNHRVRNDSAVANAAVNLGMPLVLASPSSKVSLAIVGLAESLIGEKIRSSPKPRMQAAFNLKSAASFFRPATT
jgi:pilus assembly protein CpaE